MIGEGKAPLRHSGHGDISQRLSRAQNRDVSGCSGSGSHWGLRVFSSGEGDKNIVGIDSDIFVKRGEEEGIEKFARDLRQSGRHLL